MKRNYKIYIHRNKINGKVYIGQTYTSLKTRFGKNGIGYKGCPVFYNAIQKYGWNNFEHKILEENIPDIETANEKEKYYIALYDSTNKNIGYNIQVGGSEQTKLSIKVYQYSLKGDYIKKYNSIADAMRDCNISNGKISDCCNCKRKSAGGYRWSYKKYDNLGEYICCTNSRTVHKYSLFGDYIKTYKQLSDVIKEMNLINGGHISNCCNGTRETAYGFMWSYEKHDKISPAKNIHNQGIPIIQYNLNGNFVNKFDNCIEASKQFGKECKKAYMSINNCLNNKSKSAYGYIWVYENNNNQFDIKDHIQYSGLMRKVSQYDKNMNYIKTFDSITVASQEVNGATGNISRCCDGKYKTAYGYIWKYAS